MPDPTTYEIPDPLEARVRSLEAEVANLTNALKMRAVRDIQIEKKDVTCDTTHATESVTVAFSFPIDFIAIESLLHDCNDMFWCRMERVNDRVFNVNFRNARGEGNRIIMGVSIVGIRIERI